MYISAEKLKNIVINEEKGTMTINWKTGGYEGAVCGVILKVEVLEKIVSKYKSPEIPYDPNYNEAF